MRAVLAIVCIWLAGLGAAAQFGKISVSYDLLKYAYADQAGPGIGLMVSVVGLVGLVFGTSAGLLVARTGARRAMLGALVLGAAISVVESFLPPLPVMMLARVLEGVSHLAIVVVGPMAIAAAASPRWQGLAMTLWSSFFAVTYAVLALIAPPVMRAGGPQALMAGHAAWMAACAVILYFLMPADRPSAVPGARRQGLVAEHLAIYASPFIAAPATGFVFYTAIYVALLTLLPPQFGPGWQPVVAAGMPAASILVSLTLGVWALSRISAVRLVQLGYATGAIAMAGLGLSWGQPALSVGFALMMAGAMGITQGASFASIPQLTSTPADRARASGAVAQLGNLGTTTGTPVLAALTGLLGPIGFVVFALPLCLGGIAMLAWQARRRAG